MDVLDGVRAKRNPELKTPNGQLIDGYADRDKEFIQLAMRAQTRANEQKTNTYASALSCFLPSIARAQAECLGAIVPELDAAGGSALSRNKNLLVSLLQSAAGLSTASYNTDMRIMARNVATFRARLQHSQDFNWAKLSTYDPKSVERLKLYVEMFQQAVKKTKMQSWAKQNNLQEYLTLKISPSVLKTVRPRD